MKQLTYLSLLAAACVVSSCEKIDPTQELNNYSDCLTVSVDTITGATCATEFASLNVSGNMSTENYTLKLNDFQLYDGAPLTSATLSNLLQFAADVPQPDDKPSQVKYYFFRSQDYTNQEGSMYVDYFRFGWLSNVYWLNFTSGPFKGWSVPRRYNLYATYNKVNSSYGSPEEKAIYPKYSVKFDVQNQTVSISATGVKYPVNPHDVSMSLDFRSMEWNNLPIVYTPEGFETNISDFSPMVDGSDDEWRISSFRMKISADYDGEKTANFTLTKADGSLQLRITTNFSYSIPKD